MADLLPGRAVPLPPSSRYLGRRIVVTWADGRLTTGRLAGVTVDTLSQLLDGGAQTVIPYASITSVVLAEVGQHPKTQDGVEPTITLPVETARELTHRTEVDGWKVVRNEYVDSSRWTSSHELVIERGGLFYRARYEQGLTEDQQTGPFEFGYPGGVEFGRVEKRARMVEVVDYTAPAEQDGAGR